MDLIDCCEQYFGTDSLYDVLGVEKTVTTKELKQAYKKASLFLLPAQAPAHRLDEFCRKFEILAKVHYILSDETNRKDYDETGVIDSSIYDKNALFWTSYWKELFPHIVPEDIEDFKERYKDSEEEKEDIRIVYVRTKGNMDRFAEIYFAYTAEDEDRMCYIMREELISRKKMRSYVKFANEKPASIEARQNKYKKPDAEDDPACINPIVSVRRQKRLDLKKRAAEEIELRKRKEAERDAEVHEVPRRTRRR